MSDTPDERSTARRRQMAVQMAALGLEFSSAVIGGLILGYYLDEWLGTEPWLTLLGTFAGLGTAVARMIALTRRFETIRDERRP
ncbi:MAG: AtpZ/AtpI family protein [Deltaproteobacteria bacterium]|nr:AtpZ/AtpI family protein [Deltaproteobacteria bacterium]